jgi:epsilon-lactone hydrolase
MTVRLQFTGPWKYRAKSAAMLCKATADVCLRRLRNGSISTAWNLAAELGTEILKRQLVVAFEMPDVEEARSYLDAFTIHSGTLAKVSTTDIALENFKGSWFIPKDVDPAITLLYLHGGGYSFYPKSSYSNFAAMITLSAKARLFALDYRLAPEHKFPAQLTDATNAYRWLLGTGVNPKQLVVLGDSAGGNLTLALLLSLRDSTLPLPALAICLSPATDFGAWGAGAPVNSEFDWITQGMTLHWADWFCSQAERSHPLVSPVNADLRGLPPIYIQAGGSEILLPSIQMLVDRAKEQGSDVVLDTWPAMNHDFQLFGYDVPQSAEAIKRIGEMIALRIPRENQQPAIVQA